MKKSEWMFWFGWSFYDICGRRIVLLNDRPTDRRPCWPIGYIRYTHTSTNPWLGWPALHCWRRLRRDETGASDQVRSDVWIPRERRASHAGRPAIFKDARETTAHLGRPYLRPSAVLSPIHPNKSKSHLASASAVRPSIRALPRPCISWGQLGFDNLVTENCHFMCVNAWIR